MEYPPLIPYLVVSDAASAIDFYKNAFGAVEVTRHHVGDSPLISHAHLLVNGGSVMLSDDFSEVMGGASCTPEALKGTPVTLHLQMADVDTFWARAVAGGATVTMELADQFWGDRYGQVMDPFGHKWSVGQRKTALSDQEVAEASKVFFEGKL